MADLDASILVAIEAGGGLNMACWHTCETTHCRAGWAVHLSGWDGYYLENRFGAGVAGALIYAASRPGERVPDFSASAEEALSDIRRCAGLS
ncbi:MAG TPA: hypothetical protein VKD24_03420 [Candidatus Angelobacter sp.]|nr:hypothetical protein [Candidatus Angelobacter sp.]